MPLKDGGGGKPQPYDDETGRYTQFQNFARPRDYEGEIAKLKSKMSGLSMFSQERKELYNQIEALRKEQETQKGENKPKVRPQPKKTENQSAKKIGHKVTEHKEKQFEIIKENNPMLDTYHQGIREPSDIMDIEEAFNPNDIDNYAYPDFTKEDGKKALESGYVTIYSSKPIEQGTFVSPSKMMAQDYAGSGKVYSQKVKLEDVAWIDGNEGQYAKVRNYLNDYIENNKFLNNFDEETRNRFIDNFKKMPKNQQYYYSLPNQEQFALGAMQMDTRNINEYMSGRRKDFNVETKKNLDERIKNVKSAISKYELEQPITLYRGVSKEEFDGIKDGGKTTSFKSTSTDEKRAEAFARNQGGYIIEYHAGKGSRVADVNGVPNANEDEFLIDSDVKYKKITKNGNRIIIEI